MHDAVAGSSDYPLLLPEEDEAESFLMLDPQATQKFFPVQMRPQRLEYLEASFDIHCITGRSK